MLLEIEGIDVYYEKIQALRNVSLRVGEGEIIVVVGANGAGKTTLLRTISGLLRPRAGDICFDGQSIVGRPAEQIVRRGIAHVPQGRQIFANLTVSENLDMGAFHRRDRCAIREDRVMALDLFPRLKERLRQKAGSLSGGEQQMLSIARGFMTRPSLMLLDELSLGIAPLVVHDIFRALQTLNRLHTVTLILVEQNVAATMQFASRVCLITHGTINTTEKAPSHVELKQHYLGQLT